MEMCDCDTSPKCTKITWQLWHCVVYCMWLKHKMNVSRIVSASPQKSEFSSLWGAYCNEVKLFRECIHSRTMLWRRAFFDPFVITGFCSSLGVTEFMNGPWFWSTQMLVFKIHWAHLTSALANLHWGSVGMLRRKVRFKDEVWRAPLATSKI